MLAVQAGTTVQHASLHNAAQVQQKDVRIGDMAVVVKRGEIIPYVERILPEARGEASRSRQAAGGGSARSVRSR